ncbi:MAG: hypothetical protein P8O16_13230 [Algoriphagus sp.]|uniref:hypothetical protein n=1 Tax=Algoriphagus sp. TaxID=1872435 RepID=UPI002627329D|nr:hypothetical protein [Algoriphagus sp.]MDG1278239.1 hypothetical protein [Algoriphagus sp.]
MLLLAFIYPFITDVNSSISPESNLFTVVLTLSTRVLLVVISLILIFKNGSSNLFVSIISFLFYVFVLSLFSKDLFGSWTRLLIVGSNFLIIPASIYLFKDKLNRDFFFKVLTITNVLAIIYILFCSYFKIGFVVYGNETLHYGGLFFFGLYFFVFSIPLFLLHLRSKFNPFLVLIVFAETALIVLSLKRTYLILLAVFGFFYLILILFSNKRSISLLTFIILGSSFYYFYEDIVELQETRNKVLTTDSLEEEGRYLEYLVFFDERINQFSYKSLIGQNPFVNTGDFGKDNVYQLNTRDRSLHSDYAEYLYGIGIFGIILLFFIFMNLFFVIKSSSKFAFSSPIKRDAFLFCIGYLIVLLISQGVDGLYVYWARTLPFCIIGVLIAEINDTES